jgi:hypothetical protein
MPKKLASRKKAVKVGEQWALDRPGHPRQHAPVRAELERHDDPGDDAEPEGDAEYLEPELEDKTVNRAPGPQMHGFEHSEPRREPDRERREDDVERNRRSELDAGQQKRREVHWHILTSIG